MALNETGPVVLHASAVSLGPSGLLLLGASGAGKSSLALELMARGATLVADDRVIVTPHPEGGLRLSAPERLEGLIEARGVGILVASHRHARLVAAVDLDILETERLPPEHTTVIVGRTVPCLRKVESAAFPAMLIAYLRGGRAER